MKKDILLFDLGGVIVPWVGIESLMAREGETREAITAKFAESNVFNAYERGACDDAVFTTELAALFNLNMSSKDVAALWSSWVHPPFPQTLEVLKALKGDYTLACLSNTNALHWAHLNQMIPMYEIFDYCFTSQLMGVAKPAPRSFQIPLEEMGVTADRVLYFDDTLLNVEAARNEGLTTHHVDRAKGVLPVLKSLSII